MASPFANLGLGQLGNESKYFPVIDSSGSSSDEPTFLGTLLATVADKSGLKDFLNPKKPSIPGAVSPNNSTPSSIATPNPVAPYVQQLKPLTQITPAANVSGYHPDTDAIWSGVTPDSIVK